MFDFLVGFFLFFYILVCILLVFVILMQRSKQEGLGAAFGSALTDTLFGAHTSSILIKITVWLAALFFFLSLLLDFLNAHRVNKQTLIQQKLHKADVEQKQLPPARK
ncbi:preprotein translocase subunit SecG [Candidatus Methylacidiphilum infernorum]|uniref:Protein-export membrane protein SecG n=1 Tax=Candidatus Methylacidiphilum infernorum TaxID=511746 RepID=A0ABX7PUX2_9BACT|nr:preprotein translocase subunit SecG [Candidatus Methylacidiphilum infernorum]QSR86747.1 preprotein translocase subunit SecG [Candidatus Methylacidiphilum infernorum]